LAVLALEDFEDASITAPVEHGGGETRTIDNTDSDPFEGSNGVTVEFRDQDIYTLGLYSTTVDRATPASNVTFGVAMKIPALLLAEIDDISLGTASLNSSAANSWCGLAIFPDGSAKFSTAGGTSASGIAGAAALPGTSMGAATFTLDGAWHYIETDIVFGNGTDGEVRAYEDGVLVHETTGIDTFAQSFSIAVGTRAQLYFDCGIFGGSLFGYFDYFRLGEDETAPGPPSGGGGGGLSLPVMTGRRARRAPLVVT
jgi:hypothetical protein